MLLLSIIGFICYNNRMALRETIQPHRPLSLFKLDQNRLTSSSAYHKNNQSLIDQYRHSLPHRAHSRPRKRIPIFKQQKQKRQSLGRNNGNFVIQNYGHSQHHYQQQYQHHHKHQPHIQRIQFQQKLNQQRRLMKDGKHKKIAGLMTPEELADIVYGIKNSKRLTTQPVPTKTNDHPINHIEFILEKDTRRAHAELIHQQKHMNSCSCFN